MLNMLANLFTHPADTEQRELVIIVCVLFTLHVDLSVINIKISIGAALKLRINHYINQWWK